MKTNIILTILILLTIYLVFKSIYDYKKLKNLEKIVANSFRKLPRDFEKDFAFLEKSINDNFEYFQNTLLSSLKSKKSDSLLRDNEAENIISSIVLNIEKDLSDEYKECLSYYISDIDYYITKRINALLTPYLIALNVNKLN